MISHDLHMLHSPPLRHRGGKLCAPHSPYFPPPHIYRISAECSPHFFSQPQKLPCLKFCFPPYFTRIFIISPLIPIQTLDTNHLRVLTPAEQLSYIPPSFRDCNILLFITHLSFTVTSFASETLHHAIFRHFTAIFFQSSGTEQTFHDSKIINSFNLQA